MSVWDRESLFKKIFIVSDWANRFRRGVTVLSGFTFALCVLLLVCLLLFDFGFRRTAVDEDVIFRTYQLLFLLLFLARLLIELMAFRPAKWFAVAFRILVLLAATLIFVFQAGLFPQASPAWGNALGGKSALVWISLALALTQTHRVSHYLNSINVSASFLFAGSFLTMILIGSGLLLLPNATVQPISYYEAFFTAASAVCVTGMMILDPSAVFSPLGKGILLVLVQIGGLGIMTFTGFFSYLFLGSASLKDRFTLKDFFSGEQLEGLYKLLLKILLLTILVEAAGAVVIYRLLEGDWADKTHSAVFHSISAFCNAGFSLPPHGGQAVYLRANEPLQLVICFLVILGGIGFPLLLHLYTFLKHKLRASLQMLSGRKIPRETLRPALGDHLALNTTIVLLIGGAVLYYVLETGGALTETFVPSQGVKAFVASVNARTSGFNMMDLTQWSYPTLFLTMFLMWVGASPGSTGGGIKTTTLSIAVRTVINFLRGRNRLEIGNREIGAATIIRVFAIIFLSLIFVFCAFMLLMIFEPGRNPVHLLFECFAAFSTTGLSVANTATLGTPSQVVLLILMFVGRIGPVILLSGLLLTKTGRLYRLPVEEIKIN